MLDIPTNDHISDGYLMNVTIIYGTFTLIILITSFILFILRNTLLSKWKASKFHILSSFGIIMILLANNMDIFFVNSGSIPFYCSLIYHVGFDLAFIPVLLRGWRIVCLHSRTFDFPITRTCPPRCECRTVFPSQIRVRSTRWFWVRIAVLFAFPAVFCVIFAIISLSVPGAFVPLDLIMQGYDCLLMMLMMAVFALLIRIHKRVNYDELDERRTMLTLCVLALAFCTEDIIMWFYVVRVVAPPTGWAIHLTLTGVGLLLVFLVTAFNGAVQLVKNRNKRAPPAPRVRPGDGVSNPLHGRSASISTHLGAKEMDTASPRSDHALPPLEPLGPLGEAEHTAHPAPASTSPEHPPPPDQGAS